MKDTSLSARRALRESASGYAFILPQMIGFFLFVLIPLVNVFIYSFQNRNMLFGTSNPIGFQNYVTLFQDSLFYLTLKNTLVFSVFLVPLNLALALGLALYLGEGNLAPAISGRLSFCRWLPPASPGPSSGSTCCRAAPQGRSTGRWRSWAFRDPTGFKKKAGPWPRWS